VPASQGEQVPRLAAVAAAAAEDAVASVGLLVMPLVICSSSLLLG
jgi:hypothetical protein